MSPEKRKCERPDILLTLEFKKAGGKNDPSLGISRDFSTEGLSFDSQNYNLGPGEILECTLKHPDSGWSATLRGEIVWKKESWFKCMTGLRFIDLNEEYKGKLIEFISLNEKTSVPPLQNQGEASKKIPEQDSTSRVTEPVTEETASNISFKEIIDRPEAEEIPSDEIKTIFPEQKLPRKTATGRIRKSTDASVPRIKMLRNVLLVIACFAVITAGVLFFAFETSKKPGPPNASSVTNAGHPGADDLSSQLPVQKQTQASPTEDKTFGNNTIYQELAAAKPDEKRVETEQPAREPVVVQHAAEEDKQPAREPVVVQHAAEAKQPAREPVVVQHATEEAKLPLPEPGSVSEMDIERRESKNTVRFNADIPPADVKEPEKIVKEPQPDFKQETESVTEIKGQTSREPSVQHNTVPVQTIEDKIPALSQEKIPVYKESSDNGAGKWDTFNTIMASAYTEGKEYYVLNKRKTGAHIVFHPEDFSFDSDFIIDVSMRLVKSSGYYSYGVVFGAKDAFNNYTFQIKATNLFSIRQTREGVPRELKGGRLESPGTAQNSPNTLKVVRQGNNFRFYINDALVYEASGLAFSGGKVGFIVEGETEIAATKIRLPISVYKESSGNGAGKWDTFNTIMASAYTEGKEYHVLNKRKTGAHIVFHPEDFSFDSDFILDISMRLVKSSGYYSYGVVFGAKDAFNNYTFQIKATNLFSIRQTREGVPRELKGGRLESPGTAQNSPNTLKVVRQGNNFRFYINDALVYEIPNLSFTGKKVGIFVDGESEVAVDKTRIQIAK